MMLHRGAAALSALGLALLMSAGPAAAQDITSVSVRPHGTSPADPNGGGWFVYEVDPGGSATGQAAITNPAAVAQDVTLEIRDLVFDDDGNGALRQDEDEGIGLWGHFAEPTIRIPAKQIRIVDFTVRIPADAEPGDHIGALVASTTNVQGDTPVTRRIATRLYVTVAGEAVRSMVIDPLDVEYDSKLWPSSATVAVPLENDGRIRLRPRVTVAGNEAAGSAVLLSRSTEIYVTNLPVRWWGGILRLPVQATADGGLTRAVNTSKIVVPWGLILVLIGLAALGYLARRWWTTRGSATAELRADIQRLERIVTQVAAGGATPAPPSTPEAAEEPDEEALLRAAWKRAQRSGDGAAMARVALGLHALTGNEKAVVVEAIEHHDGKHRPALELALTDYEPAPAKKAAPKKAAPRKPASGGHSTAKRAPAKKKG